MKRGRAWVRSKLGEKVERMAGRETGVEGYVYQRGVGCRYWERLKEIRKEREGEQRGSENREGQAVYMRDWKLQREVKSESSVPV